MDKPGHYPCGSAGEDVEPSQDTGLSAPAANGRPSSPGNPDRDINFRSPSNVGVFHLIRRNTSRAFCDVGVFHDAPAVNVEISS